MSERIYLDWNATAPLRPEARQAMTAALGMAGNPSSVHRDGQRARGIVDRARADVAALVGAAAKDVVFTSGGSEANAQALSPRLGVAGEAGGCARLLVSAIEHPSVLAGGRFSPADVAALPVDENGVVLLGRLQERLTDGPADGRPLVSIMLANNETGVIQPVRAAADIVHAAGGLLHVDAVQAAGRLPVDMEGLGADLLTLSAHKIGGPQGAGALVKRSDRIVLDPLIRGGGQERGARAGTENVAGIAGFGAAAVAAREGLASFGALSLLRDRLETGLRAISPAHVIFGAGAERLANTVLFAFPGIKAETALIALDLAGVSVSSGAACSSGKVSASHVLRAMGIDPSIASGAIRVSFGDTTRESDIEAFLRAWRKCVAALGKGKQGLAA